MDFSYFLNAILQKVDPVTAALVLILMGVIRFILPTPEGEKAYCVPPWVNRYILPILPYPLGVVCYMLITTGTSMEWTSTLVKGIMSGGLADIAYRKFKVVVLGD